MKKCIGLIAVAVLAGGCHDSPTAPAIAADALTGSVGIGLGYLSARVSAIPFLERRIEYDWTVRKYVSEIMDEHMVAEGSTTHTVLLPGQTKWIGYYIDPAREFASQEIRSGVRGEVCVTNAGVRTSSRIKVLVQLQASSNGTWIDVHGTTTAIRSDVEMSAEATLAASRTKSRMRWSQDGATASSAGP
jgi:hypothetical protein